MRSVSGDWIRNARKPPCAREPFRSVEKIEKIKKKIEIKLVVFIFWLLLS